MSLFVPFRRRVTDEGTGAPWLITFSDLLFLLLTGFVMRLSMAVVEDDGLFVNVQVEETHAEQRKDDALVLGKALVRDLRKTIGDPVPLEHEQATIQFGSDVILTLETAGVRVKLGEGGFLSGSREISPGLTPLLQSLGRSLAGKPVNITVEGHTDNIPISTPQFPSNWDLSAARAISVAQVLAQSGVSPRSISAVGYGATRPLATNDTDEGRSQNRRVEIFVTMQPDPAAAGSR